MAFNLGGSCRWWGTPFSPPTPRSLYLQFQLSFSLSLSLCLLFFPAPFSLSLCIIYSHFLAIKMERCCRIFACSATLQCWWIILHPANWKASLSFMSALCWFTIKTYCTVLWVEGPALRGTNKKQKWGWSRYVHMLWGHFFFFFSQPRMRKCRMRVVYICVYGSDLWRGSLFFFFFYLCPLSRSVPLRFYVNFSYQPFSLWGLAVLCEWSDGHSSLCLSLVHTLTRARTHSERWLMCGWSVRGARAAEVGWCRLGVKWGGCADQPRTSCSGLFLLV